MTNIIAKSKKKSNLELLFSLQLEEKNIKDWVTEYKFHPTRRFRFDFAWPDHFLALEIEGGIYSRGRHVRPVGFKNDCEKYNEAAILGWTVIRVTSDQLNNNEAIGWITRALINLGVLEEE
jgi:very-short-patch-repair endonuclease